MTEVGDRRSEIRGRQKPGIKLMRKLFIHVALSAMFLALSFPAEAQQLGKVPRIGFLSRRSAPTPTTPDPLFEAFRQGLVDLGYVEGKNILVEYRYAQGIEDRLQASSPSSCSLRSISLSRQLYPGSAPPSRRPRRSL